MLRQTQQIVPHFKRTNKYTKYVQRKLPLAGKLKQGRFFFAEKNILLKLVEAFIRQKVGFVILLAKFTKCLENLVYLYVTLVALSMEQNTYMFVYVCELVLFSVFFFILVSCTYFVFISAQRIFALIETNTMSFNILLHFLQSEREKKRGTKAKKTTKTMYSVRGCNFDTNMNNNCISTHIYVLFAKTYARFNLIDRFSEDFEAKSEVYFENRGLVLKYGGVGNGDQSGKKKTVERDYKLDEGYFIPDWEKKKKMKK